MIQSMDLPARTKELLAPSLEWATRDGFWWLLVILVIFALLIGARTFVSQASRQSLESEQRDRRAQD
jgi:hypothetical protein